MEGKERKKGRGLHKHEGMSNFVGKTIIFFFAMSAHVLYRLPNEKVVHQIDAHRSPLHLEGYDRVGESRGYVFAPFAASPNHPILLIEPEQESTWSLPTRWTARHVDYVADEQASRKEYEQSFAQCLQALSAGQVEKIVLSRPLTLQLDSAIEELEERNLFVAACNNYPHAYVALIKTEESGVWLVATPEVLVEERDTGWHTMALAATMQADEGEDLIPSRWSESHRREQGIVADYIYQRLCALGVQPFVSELHVKRAAHLVHLCTDFSWPSPSSSPLGKVVEALHPTPAVCGWPTMASATLLRHTEGHDRSYYAGFSGPVGLAAGTHLFVTLRCMQLLADKATLYAGGGLLASSQMESEWIETQRKMKTMLRLLQ